MSANPQPTFTSLVERVKEDLDLAAVNARIVELEAMREGIEAEKEALAKERTDMADAISEIRQRLARKETLTSDASVRFLRSGRVTEKVSAECGRHLVDVLKGRALSSGTDSEGGYLIAPEYASEILRLIPTVGTYTRIARIVPMNSNEKNYGSLASSVSDYWPGESAAITPSYPAFDQLKLIAKIHAAITDAPESLLDDADPDLGQFIAELFIESLAGGRDRVGFAGSTVAGDPFNGLLFATGVTPKVMADTKTRVSDVTADNLLDLQTTVPDGGREGAMYILSPTVFDHVRKLKDTTNNYIWQRPVDGAPGTIWGKPYEISEKMPALTTTVTASKAFIVYGNPRWAFLGDRKQVAVRVSDVAGDSFSKVKTMIRAHERVAINSFGPAFAKLVTAAS
jgi:HK97 family phage major capsid protein